MTIRIDRLNERCTLYEADCLDVLRFLPDNSVDSICTDPPAGIAFASSAWDRDKGGRDAWIAWMQEVAAECLRVVKPGGHALVWAFPRTSHWTGMAWENAGWEPRDKIVHLFGTGQPKAYKLKPAAEDWWLLRKPLEGTVAANVSKHGTGALRVDDCKVEAEQDNEPPRWPTNCIHDGSAEVVAGFPPTKDRFFYAAKASVQDREEGLDALPYRTLAYSGGAQGAAKRGAEEYEEAQGIGLNNIKKRKNPHPTVKNTELMRYLTRLITPKEGICLDPFMGSGSTGKACMIEGFRFIGIEKEPEYLEVARGRILHATNKAVDSQGGGA